MPNLRAENRAVINSKVLLSKIKQALGRCDDAHALLRALIDQEENNKSSTTGRLHELRVNMSAFLSLKKVPRG